MAIQGHVAQRCSMGSDIATDLGDLSRGSRAVAARMRLDCNVPFVMSIRAQNGAIQHSSLPRGQGGYGGAVPYSLDVEMPVRRPDSEVIAKTFEGQALLAGQSFTSDGGIAIDGLLLRLNVGTTASPAGLLAGNYGEVIQISIAPS